MAAIDFLHVLESAGQALPQLAMKASLVLAAAAVISFCLRRRSASARHLVWVSAIAGVLALPFAQLIPLRLAVLPASLAGAPSVAPTAEPVAPPALEKPVPGAAVLAPLPASAPAPSASPASGWLPAGMDRGTMLLGLWIAGTLLLLGRMLVGTATLWWLARTGTRIDDEGWTAAADRISRGFDGPSARLIRTRWSEMPMTWGIIRPVVLLPVDCDEWPAERRDVVLRHELAHVARRDVLTLALAQVACAVHWFNPLSWVALHQLRAEAERCCDDWVLSTGTRASTYAGHLLEMVRVIGRARVPAAVVLPMAQRSTFEGRLLAILEPGIERGAPGRRRAALTAGGVAALVLAVGAMRPAEARAVRGAVQPLASEESASGYRVEARVSPKLGAAPAAALATIGSPKSAVARTDTPPAGPDIDDLVAMRAVGVDAAYVAGMRAAGYAGVTRDQLISMRATGVTPQYAREMNALGWGRISADDLIGMRAVGVTTAWLEEMRRVGVHPRSADEATGMRAVGVTAGFVAEMRGLGYTNASPDDLTGLRALGVSREFVQEMVREEVRDLSAENVQGLRGVGVTGAYVAELRAAGLAGLDAETLTGLRAVGVTAAYIRELAGVGLTGLSADELTTLGAHRIDAAYVRELRAAGFADLTADQLVRVRLSGADRELKKGRDPR